jgi:DNA invertase Pin-like site-specific DNA recombinase
LKNIIILNATKCTATKRLTACGVGFHSYTEAHLATDNELVRNILLALLASLAKIEAQKVSERTRAHPASACRLATVSSPGSR